MSALLDVNVLIALLDSDHSLHARATRWFTDHSGLGWASCPITQNGCVRIMAHPGYPNAVPIRAVVERLREATQHSLHAFWPDAVSIVDERRVAPARIHGPRQITDVYLLALAVQH
ncbi:MAG: TA system VapC family ribonuclease toxin, partial [Terriglobia bacterium]